MLDLNIIDNEILNLEKKDTSYAVVERLAWLYVVRDHMVYNTNASRETTPEVNDGSEFLKSTSGVDISKLLCILDEHMSVMKVVYPKEHDALIQKIRLLNEAHQS